MKKNILTLFLFSFLCLHLVSPTWALTLDTIGSSATTNGNPGTEWYYTAENPTLTGTAAASSTVTIAIDSTDFPVSADTTGNWSYSPSTLTTGDRLVSITGDGQTLNFTLHVGQSTSTSTTTTSASSSAQTLPQTGTIENTLLLFSLGTAFMLVGWKLSKN